MSRPSSSSLPMPCRVSASIQTAATPRPAMAHAQSEMVRVVGCTVEGERMVPVRTECVGVAVHRVGWPACKVLHAHAHAHAAPSSA